MEQFVGTLLDRTGELERERQVQHARLLLELSQKVARMGTFVWDPVTDSSEWSREISSILGVTEPLSAGEFAEILHPDDVAAFRAVRDEVLVEGMAGPVELRILRPDGEVRTLVHHVMSAGDPEISPHVGVMQDVTERVRMEERLRVSKTMEAIGQLAAGVAHDVNNLLTVIRATADELALDRPDPRLSQINAAVDSGTALVHKLLSAGRQARLRPRTISLSSTVRDLSEWGGRIVGTGVQVEFDLAKEDTLIAADPAEIHEILLNLLRNARDAMPVGGRVTVRTRQTARRVRLEVVDEGTGMSPDVMRNALEPFFTTKMPGAGTGLGLAMVNAVAGERGGTVSLRTPANGGLEVVVEFPRLTEPARTNQPSLPEDPSAGWRVLLVDDDGIVRRVAERVLQRAGFGVTSVGGTTPALAWLREHRPDVVVTDLSMPNGGGRAVAEEVLRLYPEVPVVFVSGSVPNEALPGQVVQKPYDPQALISTIRSAVARGT